MGAVAVPGCEPYGTKQPLLPLGVDVGPGNLPTGRLWPAVQP